MTSKMISEATNIQPRGSDKLPLARVGSNIAYNTSVSDLRSGVLDLHDFGVVGDGSADDITGINAALATGILLGHGTTRPGGILVRGRPGKLYRITQPINLCDMQGVILDFQGSILIGQTNGLAMAEIIGSQDISIWNVEFWGEAVNSPGVGTWTARSTSPHGSNSANIMFKNVHYRGYFNKAAHYCIGSESNHFHETWTYLYGNTGCAGLIYVSTLNDLGLTPVHTSLAATTYGNWDMDFHSCGLTSGAGYTSLVVRDFCGVSIYDTYLYSTTNPTILLNGGSVKLVSVGLEGTPDNSIQIDANAYPSYSIQMHDVGLGSPNNYSIYAADNMTMVKSKFLGMVTPGMAGGVFKPMRFWRAEGCDFTGLHSNDSRAFEINFDKGYSYQCKFNLSSADTLTYTNGAYSVDDFVENFVTSFDAFLQVPAGGVKFNSADNRIATVKKSTSTWNPGLVYNGASVTAYVAITGVTGDASWVSMASFTGLDEIGWDLSSYAVAGGVYVTLTNRSGGDITVPSATLFVVAMKVV